MAHMTNPLATIEQLYQRTSSGALPSDLQDVVFFATQTLTQAAGLLLRLPQSVTACANVVLARYWLVESPLLYEFSDASATSLYLVAKLSSHPCPARDICNVYAYLLSPSSRLFRPPPPAASGSAAATDDPSTYYLSDTAYTTRQTQMLKIEARILYSLSFDTHVALPHPLAVTYLQALDFLGGGGGSSKTDISRLVCAYLNTALLSPQMLYLTHQPNALAVAAIYNAARDLGARMPDVAWWEVFDVDREELGFLVVGMRSLGAWVSRQKDEFEEAGLFESGMVTRDFVEREMARRGQAGLIRNGGGGGSGGGQEEEVDEETAMMMRMDAMPA
ncbi:cyclin [Microdochium trichocladiopsis]|uniref:Cyclin n=1 Tax=Microdochium trichocladiopsis TaxID=1682393 RepID=A0A9P8Y6Z1_9PEZI|nr:cyclin [Microdochium trichocladiopsis]KAH7030863.1 cyclin [Microdochium trichocladiopsis]